MSGKAREHWGSKTAFVLAAAGSAVGLGNIWKFPYIAHHNGGGKFVLIYLLCIAIVGLPVLVAEMMVGRATQKSPVAAVEELSGKGTPWAFIGYLGVAASFVVLSFYIVVAGWVMHYIVLAATNTFAGMQPEQFGKTFGDLYVSPGLNIFWATFFMAITYFVVKGGIKGGIERTTNLLMPGLFVLLILILVWCVSLPNGAFSEALNYLFTGKDEIEGAAVLEALGHSFFTLSLGMGAMLTYGSYLDNKVDLFKAGMWVAILDTVIALVASIIIMSIMFANTESSFGGGPGLLFVNLPQALVQMPGGYFVTLFFFVLVFFAALTSAISLLEVAVAFLIDKGWDRKLATNVMALSIWIVGIPSALSASDAWKAVFGEVTMFDIAGKTNFFDKMDYLASNWMLPIGGLAIALYVGFSLSDKLRTEQFHLGMNKNSSLHFKPWELFTRFIAPAVIILIIMIEAGVVKKDTVNNFFDQVLGQKSAVTQQEAKPAESEK
ncbi:MAG: sodium-dependent transporter [bacterium]|nr:sodium-dependent transporter [bacterium]